jgi:hypothetical protein
VSGVTAPIEAQHSDHTAQRRKQLGRIGLLFLIAAIFVLDIVHGVAIGQDGVLFGPAYRLRQSLAVTISRLREPPLHGYLAYRSIIDVFSAHGFAFFDDDKGERLWQTDERGLVDNVSDMNAMLREAMSVPIVSSLQPEIIQANELGYADYAQIAFRIFGVNTQALYYFYYVILGVSCALFVLQFRNSAFLLYLLTLYLGGILFLQNYADAQGSQLFTVANSRLFSALSLPAALHIVLVLWERRRPSVVTALAVLLQSIVIAFVISCRYEAMWQVLMIVTASGIVALRILLERESFGWTTELAGRCSQLWPAVLLLLVLFGDHVRVDMTADQRYAYEPKTHTIWPEVLGGILSVSPSLQKAYTAGTSYNNFDNYAYFAIIEDLNARHDTGSPISTVENREIGLDLWRGFKFYDDLSRAITFRVIREHPLLVIGGIYQKMIDQAKLYAASHGLALRNFRAPIAVVMLAALTYFFAGGMAFGRRDLRGAFSLVPIFLIFAALTPAIEPSTLAAGTLVTAFVFAAFVLSWGAAVLIAAALRSPPEDAVPSTQVT